MKTWTVGEKNKAICEDCGKLVETTFGLHDVPVENSEIKARAVLAATCDECGSVVAIPAISADTVREAVAAYRLQAQAER
jgi:hypothetical protein